MAMKHRLPSLIILGAIYGSLSSPAEAYLDGATGSMVLQAIIGGVATAGVFGRHYIARIKGLFARDTAAKPDTQNRA